LIILFLVTGCAKINAEYNMLRNNKQYKTKTFATLPEQKLETDKELTLKLGDTIKDVIVLNKQRVFASKLSISQINRPFSVDISSFSLAGFFAPKIFFLDKNNRIVKTATVKDLKFDRGVFKGTIFINKNYKKIHSIIVTQDLSKLNSKYNISYVDATPIAVPVGPYIMTYTVASRDQNKTLENAYGGTVKIKLKVYNPAKVI
jgi:hypothetical protein